MASVAVSSRRNVRTIIRVTHALLIRELMIRYGRRNIGFLWLIAEPLLLVLGVMLVWVLVRSSSSHGISVTGFALTGYSMLMLFRHSVQIGIKCLQETSVLLFHRDVAPFFVVFAKMFLETFGCLLCFSLSYGALVLFEVVRPAHDYLYLMVAWLSLALFGFGISMFVAGMTEFSQVFARLLPPITYVTLPLTGAFTLVAWLPEHLQTLLLYSPMVHMMEMFRYGFFGEGIDFHFNLSYLSLTTLAMLLVGAMVFAAAERRMQMR